MFGKNPIRSATNDPDNLAVETMFYTLQGEGPYAGMPALFIRLSGCVLRCFFCDTQFEEQAEHLRSVQVILAQVLSTFPLSQRKLVVLTGGEPLRQNCIKLIQGLLLSGTDLVQIETAGVSWVMGLEKMIASGHVVLVCSPKTPNLNTYVRELCHHWKYVVSAGEVSVEDGLPNRGTQAATKDKLQTLYRIQKHERPDDTIWVSPCDSYSEVQNQMNLAAAVDSCLKFGYRLSLQIHKIAGLE